MSVVSSGLSKYVSDVAELVSGPRSFLEKRQKDGKEHILGAIVFLMLSATLSAIIMEAPGSAKLSRTLEDAWIHYAWDSFRYHVVPATLFVCLQTLVVAKLVCWHGFLSVYAHIFGSFLILRSVVITVVHSSGDITLPARLEELAYLVFMLLLVNGAASRYNNKNNNNGFLPLFGALAASTIVIGYIVGLYQIATRPVTAESFPSASISRPSNSVYRVVPRTVDAAGVFEPIPRTLRGIFVEIFFEPPVGLPLVDGVNQDRLEDGDSTPEIGKYQDAWKLTVDGSAEEITIEASSEHFDTVLILRSSDGALIAENDDSDIGTDSQITSLLEPGSYEVIVTSFYADSGGDYTVTLTRLNDGSGER